MLSKADVPLPLLWAHGERGWDSVPEGSQISHSLPSSPRPVVPPLIPAAYKLLMPLSGDRGMEEMTAAGGAPCPQPWQCILLLEDCEFILHPPSRRDLPCCARGQLQPQGLRTASTEGEHCAEGLQAVSCRGKHRNNSVAYKPSGDTMHRSGGIPFSKGSSAGDRHSCLPHAGQGREAMPHRAPQSCFMHVTVGPNDILVVC